MPSFERELRSLAAEVEDEGELAAELEAMDEAEAMLGALSGIAKIGSGIGKFGSGLSKLGSLGRLGGLAKLARRTALPTAVRVSRVRRPVLSGRLGQVSRQVAAGRAPRSKQLALARLAKQRANRTYGKTRLPRFAFGEIKPDSQSGRARGVRELSLGWRSRVPGNRALFTYDEHGNVSATIWNQRGKPVWNGVVGVVPRREMPRGVPYGDRVFGRLIEGAVRREVQRATGRRFVVKHGSAGGPDLFPRGR